jgi:hypothetical protein
MVEMKMGLRAAPKHHVKEMILNVIVISLLPKYIRTSCGLAISPTTEITTLHI